MTRTCRLAVAGLVGILAAGCGGDDSKGHLAWCAQPDGPYDGARALYAAYCDAMSRCDVTALLGYAFRCRQECVQTFEFGLTCSIDDEGSDDPFGGDLVVRTLAWDEATGAGCIDWLAGADCAEVARFLASGSSTSASSDDEDSVVPEACRGALGDPNDARGSGQQGDPCEDDRDCGADLRCGEPEADGDRVYCAACTPLPGANEPCFEETCRADSYCAADVDPHECRALGAIGDPCTGSTQCASGLCFPDRCVEPLADGQPCEIDYQCASAGCVDGACGVYQLEGEPCDHDGECATQRCYEQTCIALRNGGEACDDRAQCRGDSCYRGQCANLQPEYGPCDEDAHCANGNICYEHVCTQPDRLPAGAPCVDGSICATSTCIDGRCAVARSNGDACGGSDECQTGVCEDGFCGLRDGSPCWSGEECRSGRCPNHGVCTAPKADGEDCVYPEECLSNECVDGRCFTALSDGAVCTGSAECESRYCEAGQCAPRRRNGEPCTVDEGCVHENCDENAGLCGYATGEDCPGGDDWCQGFCDAGVCADDVAEGDPCDRDEQCPAYCSRGTCVDIRPFGDVCRADEECVGGLCVLVDAGFNYEYQCRGPGQCRGDEECEEGQFCDDAHFPGVCTPLRADGEECDDDSECLHYCQRFCPLGEPCHSECVAHRPYGASCSADEECEDDLCLFGSCQPAGTCSSDADCTPPDTCNRFRSPPTCTPPADTGGACREDSDCETGWCSPITDTCGVQPSLGDACRPFECTRDAYCRSGTCVARKGPGEACDDSFYDDAECLGPYLCREGECQLMPLDCEPSEPGEMCAMLRVCTEDAYCDLLDRFTCKPRKAEGDACQDLIPRTTSCVAGSSCIDGACAPYATEGQSCAGVPCEPASTWCDPSASTCRPLRFRGETCSEDAECAGGDCNAEGDGTMRCDGPCRQR